MPVVRELVNRISFKVNPADKKNAQDTISKMDQGVSGILGKARTLGLAIGGSIAGGLVIGGKSVLDFNKKLSDINFLSRNAEEAEALKKIFLDLAKSSDIISDQAGAKGAAIVADLNITLDQAKKLAPLLGQIDLIRKGLDFKGVSETFSRAIKGDLEAFKSLVPGVKNLSEAFRKAGLSGTFEKLTESQKTQFLLDRSAESQGRSEELLKGAKDDLQFQIDSLQSSFSDISKQFGFSTNKSMVNLVKLAAQYAKSIKDSKSVWSSISKDSDDIANRLNTLIEAPSFFEGYFDIVKNDFETEFKSFKEFIGSLGFGEFASSAGNNISDATAGIRKTPEDIGNSVAALGRVFGIGGGKQKESSSEQNLNINLNGAVKVQNESGVDLVQIGTELTSFIFGEIKSGLNNVSAQSGRPLVGVD